MKKLMILMAIAIAAVVMTACSNDFGLEEAPQKEEPTKEDPKDNPQPQPEPKDTINWKSVMGKTLEEDDDRNVTSTILGLDWKGDSISRVLRYVLGAELTAPDTVRTNSKDLTVYVGKSGLPQSEYGEYFVRNNGYVDSLRVVTTTNGFNTNYYHLSLRTKRPEGYTRINGKDEAYKNATESASYIEVSLYRDAYEVEKGDSIILREEVKNVAPLNFHEHIYYLEKKVVVDHFLRMKESEPDQPEEPEHNHPDWWGEPVKILGQGTFVYRPGVGPSNQGLFYKNVNILFENVLVCVTTKSYVKEDLSPIDFDWENAIVYKIGSTLRGKTITSKNVTDLNSVIWRDGKWEPALCQYDQKNYSWTYMSPDGHDQGMTEYLAETCGLKNFAGKHTARLHPSLFYSASLSNGTLVIKDDNGRTIKSFH